MSAIHRMLNDKPPEVPEGSTVRVHRLRGDEAAEKPMPKLKPPPRAPMPVRIPVFTKEKAPDVREIEFPGTRLSRQEYAVLMRVAKGERIGVIADALFKSYKTISTQRCRAMVKTGFRTNVELALFVHMQQQAKKG